MIRLRLVPEGLDSTDDVTESLRKTVGGLQTVIQGICELRNTHGFASHGKEPAFQQLDSVQAVLVARASDAIVNFLFRVHRGYRPGESTRRRAYEDHSQFNQHVDELHEPVRIFEEEFAPSKVLFELAPEPYRVYLAEFELEPDKEESGPRAESAEETKS